MLSSFLASARIRSVVRPGDEMVDPPALAGVAELVYAYGSEPYPERVGGSSPLSGTSFGGQACSVQNAVPARAWEFPACQTPRASAIGGQGVSPWALKTSP